MSTPQERAWRIPVRPLAILLEEVASLRRRERRGEPVLVPRLTLHMDGGHAVTGELVAFEPSRRSEAPEIPSLPSPGSLSSSRGGVEIRRSIDGQL